LTQPSFVPIVEADQVRPAYRLQVPNIWTQSRPSELRGTSQPPGRQLGSPGPDQGFALKLARRFVDRLELVEGESAEDAIAGCTAVAMRRCARFGRAPAVYDLAFAFTLWGFLGVPGRPGRGAAPCSGRLLTTTRPSGRSPTRWPRRPSGSRPRPWPSASTGGVNC